MLGGVGELDLFSTGIVVVVVIAEHRMAGARECSTRIDILEGFFPQFGLHGEPGLVVGVEIVAQQKKVLWLDAALTDVALHCRSHFELLFAGGAEISDCQQMHCAIGKGTGRVGTPTEAGSEGQGGAGTENGFEGPAPIHAGGVTVSSHFHKPERMASMRRPRRDPADRAK